MVFILSFLLLVSFLLLLRYGRSEKKDFPYGLILVLVTVSALRPDSMPDFSNYFDFFSYTEGESHFEYLFVLFSDFFKKYFNSFRLFLFFVALISVLPKIAFIKKYSPLFWGSVAIYISNIYVLHDLIAIRAGIASGILLWSIHFAIKREFLKYIIVIFIASLFHTSSWVFLPLWFLITNKDYSQHFLIALLIAYIYALSGGGGGYLVERITSVNIQNLWQYYLSTTDYNINLVSVKVLMRVLICVLLLFGIKKRKIDKESWGFIYIYVFSTVLFFLLADVPVLCVRLSELIQVVEILAIVYISRLFKSRTLGYFVLLLICSATLFLNAYTGLL